MGWMTRFLSAVAFLAIGVLFAPETFGSKSDGQHPPKLATFLKLAHLLCFSTAFGAALWVTFIGGIIMFKNLPRHQFWNLQSKMFPAYFSMVGVCCAVSVGSFGYLHPWKTASASEKYQLGFIIAAFAFNLSNLFVFTPMTIQQIMGKKGEKQFRWSKPMEYLMLEILADEVKQGNKSTNQFKVISFNRVSNAINEQLGMDCSSKHVENHLKTLRSTWNIVQTLLNKSGLGWDDNLKMITASPRVYAMHIQAHPSHDKFINKKIDMFEEMSLVCGNDRARGDCAKSFEDIGLDCSSEKGNEDEIEGPSKENGVQDVSETSQVKSSRKRNRPSDVQDVVGDISTKLGEVAAAISKIADSRLDVTRLYEEVMAIEGYGEEFLGDAFDYLVQSDTLAKGFMAKNQNLRKVWLERFKRLHK